MIVEELLWLSASSNGHICAEMILESKSSFSGKSLTVLEAMRNRKIMWLKVVTGDDGTETLRVNKGDEHVAQLMAKMAVTRRPKGVLLTQTDGDFEVHEIKFNND